MRQIKDVNLVPEGWILGNKLKTIEIDGINMKKIKSIKSVGNRKVYDVTTLSHNKNFILSNGVVAHNCNSTQPSLRNFMEEFALNCRFILTANYANKILDPIKSRCSVIEYNFTKEEKFELIKQFDQRAKDVLTAEGITFDKSVLAEVVMRYFPDFRKIFNELQRFSHDGTLNAGVMNSFSESALVELIKYLKASEFTKMRKWIVDHIDNDFSSIVRSLYDGMYKYVESDSIPELVLILADFDYKRAFVTDPEIHLVAMLTTIMMQVKFK